MYCTFVFIELAFSNASTAVVVVGAAAENHLFE